MMLETLWWVVLGALLTGYFVLGGYDYGAQLLTPFVGVGDRGRRAVLGAVGPFVFGNEVWLVAVAGVLFGAFPVFEGTLLTGLFPLVVLLLLGVVSGNAAVQLRSRVRSPRRRRVADALVAFGGALPALLWGAMFAVLLRGVRLGADGYFWLSAGELAHPFVVLCALASLGLFLAHGACFLALRGAGELGAAARKAAGRLLPVAAVLALVVLVTGVSSDPAGVRNPASALAVAAVLVIAPVLAAFAVRRGRTGLAFAASSVAAGAPVLVLGAAQYPYLLVAVGEPGRSLSIADAAAAPATLGVLTAVGVVLLPVILGYQVWSWWVMRGRVSERTPSYH